MTTQDPFVRSNEEKNSDIAWQTQDKWMWQQQLWEIAKNLSRIWGTRRPDDVVNHEMSRSLAIFRCKRLQCDKLFFVQY